MLHDYERVRRSVTSTRKFRVTGKATEAALAADLEAVDEDVAVRIIGFIRADYGRYPRNFLTPRMIDLYSDGIAARPFSATLSWRTFQVTEDITEARVRPRNPKTDWNIRGVGNYATGGSLSHLGTEVITCRTHLGMLEFAVLRLDVPLMLRYLNRRMQVPKEG
jgi:hypothetical protein